jgi:hypothetical protein
LDLTELDLTELDFTMSALEELTDLLQRDRSSRSPKYPDQALYAVRDSLVAEAVERRFKTDEAIVRIRSLGCHRSSGLLHTVFEFTTAGAIALAPNAMLVITDGQCKVVAIVDPFDPEQPNPLLPAISGALPLALSQPADDEVEFSEEDLQPREARTRAYLQKLNVETGSGGATPRFFAVNTTSIVGYQWRDVLATVSASGKKTYVRVRYEVNGADDTGVGGDAE